MLSDKRLEDLAKEVRMGFEDAKGKPKSIERDRNRIRVSYETSSIMFNLRSGTYLYLGKDTVGSGAIPGKYEKEKKK